MRRGDIAALTPFVVVADHLNFRLAASRLGVTPSALSHTMRQLEERLGVRLLNRTTRSVSLTDAGSSAWSRGCARRSTRFQRRWRISARRRAGRSGGCAFTRLTGGGGGGDRADLVTLFVDLSRRPARASFDQAPADIVAKGFDAGIGPHDRAEADMIAVRVTGPIKLVVVGSPAYFARHRAPRTPEDLSRHDCVQYRRGILDGATVEWPFERAGKPQRISIDGRITLNDPELHRGQRSTVSALPTRSRCWLNRSCARAS